jgi:fimbrial chaperone protein
MSSRNVKGRGHARRALLVMCLLVAAGARAGSFAVSPVRATLSADKLIGSLTVRNDGAEPTVVQLQVMSWSQDDGEDVYTVTREVLATPPIFTVDPGASQMVRVGLRRAPDPHRELSYRLYLQEVPPPPEPGFQGLQVALRIGVPVFVVPTAPAQPVLHWEARATAKGGLELALRNDGNAHVQVVDVTLDSAGSQVLATRALSSYVLAGQSRRWRIDNVTAPPPGTALRLVARTDAGRIETELVVSAPR